MAASNKEKSPPKKKKKHHYVKTAATSEGAGGDGASLFLRGHLEGFLAAGWEGMRGGFQVSFTAALFQVITVMGSFLLPYQWMIVHQWDGSSGAR